MTDKNTEADTKGIAVAIMGVGMACAAAYLNINDHPTPLLWVGVFFCAVTVL